MSGKFSESRIGNKIPIHQKERDFEILRFFPRKKSEFREFWNSAIWKAYGILKIPIRIPIQENEKIIEKLEMKIEDLKKEILKNKSTKQDTMTETVDDHRKKKKIDLKAYAPRKKVDQWMQEKKEGNNKKKKTQLLKDAESATLHKHGGSFTAADWEVI